MKLIQSLLFIVLLVIGVYFIVELISENDEYFIQDTYSDTSIAQPRFEQYGKEETPPANSPINFIDQVMVKIPFSEPDSKGIKVWVFFIVVATPNMVCKTGFHAKCGSGMNYFYGL